MFAKSCFRGFLASLVLFGSLSLSARTDNLRDTHTFLGIGPLFSSAAIGYAQIGAGFDIGAVESIRFSAGPLVGFGFSPNVFLADLDGFLKASHRFRLSANYALDVYGKLPFGVSVGGLPHFVVGFNTGIIPGLELLLTPRFGIFMELGFAHHSLFPTAKNTDAKAQHEPMGLFNVGVTLKI